MARRKLPEFPLIPSTPTVTDIIHGNRSGTDYRVRFADILSFLPSLQTAAFDNTDKTVAVDIDAAIQNGTLSADRQVVLPSAFDLANTTGAVLILAGNVNGHSLVVTPAGVETINGASSYTISANYGYVWLRYDFGNGWTIIGQTPPDAQGEVVQEFDGNAGTVNINSDTTTAIMIGDPMVDPLNIYLPDHDFFTGRELIVMCRDLGSQSVFIFPADGSGQLLNGDSLGSVQLVDNYGYARFKVITGGSGYSIGWEVVGVTGEVAGISAARDLIEQFVTDADATVGATTDAVIYSGTLTADRNLTLPITSTFGTRELTIFTEGVGTFKLNIIGTINNFDDWYFDDSTAFAGLTPIGANAWRLSR